MYDYNCNTLDELKEKRKVYLEKAKENSVLSDYYLGLCDGLEMAITLINNTRRVGRKI